MFEVDLDEVIEISQNGKFHISSKREQYFMNRKMDTINTGYQPRGDPVLCPPDRSIPDFIPGIPEKLLAKHRMAGKFIPRPLINNFMVEPPISETERICRLLLTKEKVDNTRVQEISPFELRPKSKKRESARNIKLTRTKIYHRPVDLIRKLIHRI